MASQASDQRQRSYLPEFLTLAPAFLWLVLFLILPLAIILAFSLGHRDSLGRMEFGLSLHNYVRFFTGPYLSSLMRSVLLAGATTLICLIVGLPSALWLGHSLSGRWQNLGMTILIAPLWTSFLIRIYAWMTILRPTGLLTTGMRSLGISHPPVILYTPWAILLGMVYNYLPYMILCIYPALEKLDRRLLEAASDLGATPARAFLTITVPLSSRGIVAGIIMVFVPALGDYVTPDLLGGAKTMFAGNLIQNQFLCVRDWAFGSAVSSIMIVIVALAVWVYLRYGEPLPCPER